MKRFYKFRIHITEDNYNSVEVILKILIPKGIVYSFDDLETICLEWIDFKHFRHPGEAIQFYGSNVEHVDLSIVDLNFTELDSDPEVLPVYKSNTSGVLLLQELLKRFGDGTLIIPFSNVLDNAIVVKELSDNGFDEIAISKITDVTNRIILKSEQPLLENRILKKLQLLAELYFSQLPDNERIKLEREASKGDLAEWNNYPPLDFNVFNFGINKILVGWGNIINLKNGEISNLVADLLDKTETSYVFTGNWKKQNSHERLFLKSYLLGSNYIQEKKQIDLLSFDFLLNVLKIKEMFEDIESEKYKLAQKNIIKVTNNCSNKQGFRNFLFKMIGRRVAFGYNDFIGFSNDTNFQKAELAALLRNSNTNTIAKTKDGKSGVMDINNVYNTHLGISIDYDGNGSFLTKKEDKTVMYEERIWLDTFGKSLIEIRAFLDEFELPREFTKKTNIYSPKLYNERSDFTDISHFKEYLFEFKKKHIEDFEILKKSIIDYSEQNLSTFGSEIIKNIL